MAERVADGNTPALLSIVIVNWNAREELLTCLESLQGQVAGNEIEIIVVDNASTDDSVEHVRCRFPQVVVIENATNLGFAGANNQGIAQSTGEYILLINSDVIVQPGCLERLRSYLDEQPSVGLAGPRILNPDGSLQGSIRARPTIARSIGRAFAADTFERLRPVLGTGKRGYRIGDGEAVDVLSGCFWAARRTALETVGGLDETFFMYAEDTDWCVRFWNAGWSVAYLETAEAIHIGGASSDRDPVRFYVEQHRANLQFWHKHRGLPGQAAILLIMLVHQANRLVAGSIVFCLSPARRAHLQPVLARSYACARYLFTSGLRHPRE